MHVGGVLEVANDYFIEYGECNDTELCRESHSFPLVSVVHNVVLYLLGSSTGPYAFTIYGYTKVVYSILK